ncbi:MAG TPA: hypothetical protein VHY91_08395 [Pirellulales bacterium]|nr:hypothetical protein [Pirellulales bacterium]
MRYEIRELGVGGILDQAIELTKNHFPLFLGIMLLMYVPVNLLLQGLELLEVESKTDVAAKSNLTSIIRVVSLLVVAPLTNGAIIQAVSSAYLQQPITAGSALGRASRMYLPILGTMFLNGFFVLLGFLMLIVPGIIFSLWWLLAIQVVMLEGLTATAALTRSHQLMKGSMLTAMLLGSLMFIIQVMVGVGTEYIPLAPLRVVADVAVEAFLFVFTAAGWVVLYFSCRSKHERFDLAILADAVGSDLPDAAGVGAGG